MLLTEYNKNKMPGIIHELNTQGDNRNGSLGKPYYVGRFIINWLWSVPFSIKL